MGIKKISQKLLLVLGTLTLSLFFIGLSLSTPKKACAAGSCCTSGFTYQNGSCINNDYINKAGQFCNSTVATWLTEINTNLPFHIPPFDTVAMVVDCNVYLTQGAQGAGKTPNEFCSWLLPKIPVAGLNPGGPLFNTALPLCVSQIGPALTTATFQSVAAPDCSGAGVNQTCDPSTGMCVEQTQTTFIPVKMCQYVADCKNPNGSDNLNCACNICFNKPGVFTPFGCIETKPQRFIEQLLQIAIGIAGSIAFLMIVYGGFTIMTASGNPEKLNSGREIITSAIAGLLLIIFSAVILKIIGVDILKIPGFLS